MGLGLHTARTGVRPINSNPPLGPHSSALGVGPGSLLCLALLKKPSCEETKGGGLRGGQSGQELHPSCCPSFSPLQAPSEFPLWPRAELNGALGRRQEALSALTILLCDPASVNIPFSASLPSSVTGGLETRVLNQRFRDRRLWWVW
jgi:hypothetical protein